jgi:ectoine hydroxylase-related dioxygenase (phytanoyl-CoA dioxygenase family)
MAITESLKQAFESRGVINIKNLLSANRVAEAVAYTRQQFEAEGLWKDGKWILDYDVAKEQPLVSKSLIRRLKNQIYPDLIAEAEPLNYDLLDQRPAYPGADYPQPLVSLPNAVEWTVTHKSWHLDCPRLSDGGIPGVQVFTFLETVAHGGAPTLAVMGSHRLLNDRGALRSKDVVQQLKQETYFRELNHKHTADRNRFMHESGQIGEVEVQLAAMVGEPGDVYLMD